jgi:hypothetical protein
MDYGYQLLRHVVQQVFGNLRQAARLTLTLFILPIAGFLALTGGTAAGMGHGFGGGTLIGLLLLLVGTVIAYAWAAVGWHRYVLLEEMGNGLIPPWRGDRILSYLGRAIAVGVVVILAVMGGSLVVGLIAAVTQSFAVALVLGIGLVFLATWVATRIGLVLPAAALGAPMSLRESWAVTRPVASQILLPLIVIALVAGIAQQLILLLFGQTVTAHMFGMMQDQTVLSLPGQILNAALTWLQLLVNLALMTTLYGNLVEGRQLN